MKMRQTGLPPASDESLTRSSLILPTALPRPVRENTTAKPGAAEPASQRGTGPAPKRQQEPRPHREGGPRPQRGNDPRPQRAGEPKPHRGDELGGAMAEALARALKRS